MNSPRRSFSLGAGLESLGSDIPAQKSTMDQAARTRAERYIFAGVVFLSILVRLPFLTDGLGLSEIRIVRSFSGSLANMFQGTLFQEMAPPLYPLFMKLWSALTGTTEPLLRLPSLVAGVISVGLIFLLLRRRGLFSSLIGSLFIALSTFHIHFSLEVGPVSLFVCLTTLLIYLMDKWGEAISGWKRTLGLVLLEVAILTTHFYGVLVLLLVNVYFFLSIKSVNRALLQWTLIQVSALALTSFWGVFLTIRILAPDFSGVLVTDKPGFLLQILALSPAVAHPSFTWAWIGLGLSALAAVLGTIKWIGEGWSEASPLGPGGWRVLVPSPVQLVFLAGALVFGSSMVISPLFVSWFTPEQAGEIGRFIPLAFLCYILVPSGTMLLLLMVRSRFSSPRQPRVVMVVAVVLVFLALSQLPGNEGDMLFILPALTFFIGLGAAPRTLGTAMVMIVLLAAISAPGLLRMGEGFLPREDFRSCARTIREGSKGGSSSFVVPASVAVGLEYYLGESNVIGLDHVDDLPEVSLLEANVNVAVVSPGIGSLDRLSRRLIEKLGPTYRLKPPVFHRGVRVLTLHRKAE